MARVKIDFLTATKVFTTSLNVRITDLNYGNHLSNDAVLRLVHEARVQWLNHYGYTELSVGAHGLIMADAEIAYRSEGFYGEKIKIELFIDEVGNKTWSIKYKLSTLRGGVEVVVAMVKTGMVAYDYQHRKPVVLGEELRKILERIVF